jgi:hypothetical protein
MKHPFWVGELLRNEFCMMTTQPPFLLVLDDAAFMSNFCGFYVSHNITSSLPAEKYAASSPDKADNRCDKLTA